MDGGYLRKVGEAAGPPWVDPWEVCVGCFPGVRRNHPSTLGTIDRLHYCDAEDKADDGVAVGSAGASDAGPSIRAYLDAVEEIPHCSVRSGELRMGKRKREQKGVDVLLAVEMLSDAHAQNFGLAFLLAGDADFVPVVDEVRRYGASVVVIARKASLGPLLRNAAD